MKYVAETNLSSNVETNPYELSVTHYTINKWRNQTQVNFHRPLVTKNDLDLDLKENSTYVIFLNWGIFNETDSS